MKIDKELSSLATLATALELGTALVFSVAGDQLGVQHLNQLGQEGVANSLLASIQKKISESGVK